MVAAATLVTGALTGIGPDHHEQALPDSAWTVRRTVDHIADANGWAAMACDEIIVHGHDVCHAVSIDLELPADLLDTVVARLFPWAPSPAAASPLDRLLWCNGRTALPGHPRQDELWYWWSLAT